jgi:hypothetical protein
MFEGTKGGERMRRARGKMKGDDEEEKKRKTVGKILNEFCFGFLSSSFFSFLLRRFCSVQWSGSLGIMQRFCSFFSH